MTGRAVLLIEHFTSRRLRGINRSEDFRRPFRRIDLISQFFQRIGIPDVYTGRKGAEGVVISRTQAERLTNVAPVAFSVPDYMSTLASPAGGLLLANFLAAQQRCNG